MASPAVTRTSTAEYDAFGPWILSVGTPDDVPRAFRGYPFDFSVAEFILKLPRDIARRDATPDMHLYDRMLVIDSSGLTVLSRIGDGFETTRIEPAAIGAVEHSIELLDGMLSVHGIDGTRVDVPYNGASRGVVAAVAKRLVDLATEADPVLQVESAPGADPAPEADRAPATSAPARRSDPLDMYALGVHDIGLVNAYLEAGVAFPGLRILATQPGTSPASNQSFVRRLIKGRIRLSGAVVAGTDDRLVVLSRRVWLRYRGRPDLSTKHTAIVRARVTRVTTSAHPVAQGVVTLTIELGAGAVAFAMPADSDAVRVLTRR